MANILILAAGRVQSENMDSRYPVCLTEANGVSVLEKIVHSLAGVSNANYTFVFHSIDVAKYHLDNSARLLIPDARITVVPESTMGSSCTALLAACELEQENDLIIVSANEIVDLPLHEIFKQFTDCKYDAGTLVFRSIMPRYSYVMLDEAGHVLQVAQNNPISNFATAGIFWFSRTRDFVNSAKSAIMKDATTDGKFYIAPTFNELILNHKLIGVVEIDKKYYTPLKTIRQIDGYEGV